MIKEIEDGIEIYTDVDDENTQKRNFVISATIFIITSIYLIIKLIISFYYFDLFLLVVSLVFVYFNFYFLKHPPVSKLIVRLTKEYLEVYKHKKIKKYDMNKIVNFECDMRNNFVYYNYYNENNKLKQNNFNLLYSYSNYKFVDIANNLKANNIIIDKVNLPNNDNEEILEELESGKEIKLCFIGKSKSLFLNGNSYSFKPSDCIFVHESGNFVTINFSNMHIDTSKLSCGSVFTVKYNKKSEQPYFTYQNESFDNDIINNCKNRILIKSSYLFDNDEIIFEIQMVKKLNTIMFALITSLLTWLVSLITFLSLFTHLIVLVIPTIIFVAIAIALYKSYKKYFNLLLEKYNYEKSHA